MTIYYVHCDQCGRLPFSDSVAPSILDFLVRSHRTTNAGHETEIRYTDGDGNTKVYQSKSSFASTDKNGRA